MTKKIINKISIDDHLGCFGNFNIEDPICKRFCSLSLRCAIENDQNTRLEIIEDLISSDSMIITMQ